MAPVVRRSELVTDVRDYGHLEHLTHVTDEGIARRLDRSYRRLRALLDKGRGHELEKTNWSTHVAPGISLVELPADFVQLRGIMVQQAVEVVRDEVTTWEGTGDYREPLEFSERHRVDLLNTRSPGLCDYRYRLRATEVGDAGQPRDQVEILPVPTTDLYLTAVYLPALTLPTVLIGDVEDVYYMGVKGIAEEWLILDALVTVKGKTNEEIATWERRKGEVLLQLLEQAPDRDSAQPKRVRQVYHRTQAGKYPPPGRYPWLRGR